MAGPLPNPQKRRRNTPSITTTHLPAKGRPGRAPAVPKRFNLQAAGKSWWTWAWKLPQATRWDTGSLYFVARRAELEDMAAALSVTDEVDLLELLHCADDDKELRTAARNLEQALSTLKAMSGGAVGLMKEMRELDNRLGLNPKAMADLRWSIEEGSAAEEQAAGVADLAEYRERLG